MDSTASGQRSPTKSHSASVLRSVVVSHDDLTVVSSPSSETHQIELKRSRSSLNSLTDRLKRSLSAIRLNQNHHASNNNTAKNDHADHNPSDSCHGPKDDPVVSPTRSIALEAILPITLIQPPLTPFAPMTPLPNESKEQSALQPSFLSAVPIMTLPSGPKRNDRISSVSGPSIAHSNTISSKDLVDLLNNTTQSPVLILDLRSGLAYNASHLRGSFSVAIPPLLLNRVRRGSILPTTFSLNAFLPPDARTLLQTPDVFVVFVTDADSDILLNLVSKSIDRPFGTLTSFSPDLSPFLDSSPDIRRGSILPISTASPPPASLDRTTTHISFSISEIIPGLFLSSDPTIYTSPISYTSPPPPSLSSIHLNDTLKRLEEFKIGCVLNMAFECPDLSVVPGFPTTIRYRKVPLQDSVECPFHVTVMETTRFIDENMNLNEKEGGKEKEEGEGEGGGRNLNVLVHCQQGKSRSVATVIGYVMYKMGKSVEEAMEVVMKRREEADPNIGFVQVLKEVEGKLMRGELG